DPPLVWVSEAVSDVSGFHPGNRIDLPLGGRNVRLVIGGVFRDYARQHGAILIDRTDYVALTGDKRVNDGSVWLRPGVTPAAAMDAIRGLPGGGELEVSAPQAFLGALAGLIVGSAISLVLVYVVNRQSFNWSIQLHPPYALLFALTIVLVGLAILTAILSGREAMGIGPVRAVREDW